MSDSKSGLLAKLANSVNEQGEISGVDSAAVQSLVDATVNSLVNSAPDALNTLDELAAALNDDANFATTVTNSLVTKASTAYVDSAVGSIQGFSGSYDDLTNVPFQLDSAINSVFFDASTPNGMLVGDLWYSSSNSKVYKAISNPNNATVDNTQVSSPSDIIFPSPGGTTVLVTNGNFGDRNVTFNTPITIAAFYGIQDDIEIKSVTFEDDTVVSGADLGQNVRSRYYGLVSWKIEGGIFNEGKKVKSILFVRGSDANGFSFNLVASGAPIWEEIDPGYSTLDSAAVQSLVDGSISNLVNSAPEALNTLDELAAALGDDSAFATTVTNSLATKANTADLSTVATSGSYNDLTNLPDLASLGGGGGVTVYASTAQFPTDAAVGEMAYSSSSKKLYMSAGSGAWDNIALTNLNPVIQGLVESADATEGAQTFTVTATDPEGFTVTTTANVTGSSVTASYTGNTLTVTPTSTSGISVVQVQASDGSNTATAELFASNNTGAADMGPAPSIRFINDTYDGAVREPALDFGFSADFNRATGDVICAAKYNVTDTSDTNLQYGIYVLNFDGTDFTLNLSSSILDTSTLGFTDRPNPMWISSTEMAIVDADGKIGFFVRDDRNSAWRLNGNVINAISEYSLYSQSFNSIGSVSGVRLDPVTANGDNFGESFVIFHQNGTTKSSLMMGNAIPTENGGFLWFERAGGAGTPWSYNSTLSTNRTVQAQADVAGGHYGYGFDAIAIDGKDPLVLIGVPGNQYEGNSAAKVEIYSPARSAGMVYPSGMSPGPVNGNDSSSFGSAVRFINRDIMAIGAPGENKVYIQQNFKMDSVYFGGGGSMSMYAIGTPEITHPEGGSNFGYRIEVLGENTLLIGDTSSMWLYTLSSNYTATLVHKLTPQAYSISNPVRLAAGMVMHGNANGTVGTNSSGTIDIYTS